MENLVKEGLFNNIYKDKKVLITGHSGFKGSWLTYWLNCMGAQVTGISLPPPTEPNHINLLNIDFQNHYQNINYKEEVEQIILNTEPDIIFHMAAQPLVRLSYEQPHETYLTNVIGTVNVLDAARKVKNLKAIVVVTSDKCYENKEWLWGYRENEPMGGADPYSSSKGCAELVTAAYRNSYFSGEGTALLASSRAGNVIGGGDWARDRIIPDMINSALRKEALSLRYPNATRPWQHVLEPLSGYLCIGMKLLEGNKAYADGWNFGPENDNNLTVLELVDASYKYWKEIKYKISNEKHPYEANFLMLDSTKAQKLLHWKPVWNFNDTVKYTIGWYKSFYENEKILTAEHLKIYVDAAEKKGIKWAQK